jgi:hypothetical protein
VDIVSAYRLSNGMPSGRRSRIVATSDEQKYRDERARYARTHRPMIRRRFLGEAVEARPPRYSICRAPSAMRSLFGVAKGFREHQERLIDR